MFHILRLPAWYRGWNDSLIRVFQPTLVRSLYCICWSLCCICCILSALLSYQNIVPESPFVFAFDLETIPSPPSKEWIFMFPSWCPVPEELQSPKHSNYLSDLRDHGTRTLLIYNCFNSFFQLSVNWGRTSKYGSMINVTLPTAD